MDHFLIEFSRIGGEEFIIISPNITSQQNYLFANKLREMAQNHTFDVVGNLTVSIDVGNCKKDDDKKHSLKR